MRMEASFSGPIPPPSVLAQYNAIIPNGADRILKMAESQSAHRQAMEYRVITWDHVQSTRGMLCGFGIAIVGLVAGTYLGLNGHDWLGAAVAGAPLCGLVSVFVIGAKSREKERLRKDQKTRKR